MFWLWFLACWFAVSLLVALIVGPFIRFGMEGDDRTFDEMEDEREDYLRKTI